MSADGLTARQHELHTAVVRAASSIGERLMLVGVLATRLGCSSADVDAVREALVEPIATRECGDLR